MIFCKNNLKRSIAFAILLSSPVLISLSHAQDANRKALTPAANATNATAAATTDNKIRNIDGVAAVVNIGYITRKEIDDRIIAIQKQGVKTPDAAEFRKAVLERLIIEKIQLQNAAQEGIRISDKELEKIIGDIAAKNKLTLAEFKEKVIATGISFERYKENLRDDVTLTRFREREVDSRIKISDAEIDNFIAERARAISSKGAAPRSSAPAAGGLEEIDVAQIFIPVDSGAGVSAQAEAKKKAEALLVAARGDIDFMQLGEITAKENPKIKFQELGYRSPDRLPQIFYEAIRNIGSGQTAKAVVKSPAGFHVLKVLDRRTLVVGAAPELEAAPQEAASAPPQTIPITQTNSRHILIRLRSGFTDQDAERRLQGFRDQIRAKTADFGDLAKKFSEDGSASTGGELGWMSPGDLVPEFEQAMNRLQIGEVSNPVKSEFGWHLIQVTERREGELTVEKQRQFARANIRERKYEQAYQDWLRELRDSATVKILNQEDAAASTR